jgi:tRNA1Val (adenine37-N6)-methyltransferase
MRSVNIEPKFLRMIHSGWDTEAKLILLEGIKGARQGLKVGSPLVIYGKDGSYTDEVKEMFLP